MFELDNVENAAILRDFLNVWTWQHQKRSNSADFLNVWTWQRQKRNNFARLLRFSKLTTSKTKQFCETSPIFELNKVKNEAILRDFFILQSCDNIKNEAILRDFLQKWKIPCSADGLVPLRFAIFPVHLSKLLRLPRQSDARSYEVLHLSRKIILANLKIGGSKMQPLSGNQHPDLLTALMNMSLVLRLPRKMHLGRSCSNVPRLQCFWKCYKTLKFCSLLRRCTIPCACHAKRHLNVQKWSEHVAF